MHILCCCQHGNNRSVTMSHILKYVDGFETLTCGLSYNSPQTLEVLFNWADVIVVPEESLLKLIPKKYEGKIKFYNIGEDVYPRPFNKALYTRAKEIMENDPIR